MDAEPHISLVIPFFNEKENVTAVCQELQEVLPTAGLRAEVILIDDGSDDGTAEAIEQAAAGERGWRTFHLASNQGQSAALLFGFGKARAPVIVTMDGDGQNDPRDIAKLLQRLPEADMVVGIRVARQDSWARRKISGLANRVRAQWLGDGLSDAGCALKVFRKEVTESFLPIRTLYSFMPALCAAAGYRVIEEPVRHRPRRHGRSKYPVSSFLFFPLIDCLGVKWFKWRRCKEKTGSERDLPATSDRSLQRPLAR